MELERCRLKAAKALLAAPDDVPVAIIESADEELWLGIGYLVGRGQAVYRGGWCFCLTPLGRKELVNTLED